MVKEPLPSVSDAHEEPSVDQERRQFLKAGVCLLGGLGVLAASYPLIKSLAPTASVLQKGAPMTVDISQLQIGEQKTVEWQGKPVWIIRRSAAELETLKQTNPELKDPDSTTDQQPNFARNAYRSLRPDILVLVGICTHLGCIPNFLPRQTTASPAPSWAGGFLCPCHGSRYDLSGRVYKNMPAPLNLYVPPYHFPEEHLVVIGV